MSKHTKSNKTNAILKTISFIAGGGILILVGVVVTLMITAPNNTPTGSFSESSVSKSSTEPSSSEVKSEESTTEESDSLQGPDVTTRQSTQNASTSSSTEEQSAGYTYAQEPVHGTYQVRRTGADYIVWGTPEGICYVQPTTRQTLNQRSVHDMEQILFALGVKDVGDIDSSKLNDMATGLSVDITKPFKPSAGPVYIYTNNTPAAYTLAD